MVAGGGTAPPDSLEQVEVIGQDIMSLPLADLYKKDCDLSGLHVFAEARRPKPFSLPSSATH